LDVYILPSRNEGLPLSLLEAMYFRTPIIASAVGGIPEVIRDGISGRLVLPEEPQKLAAAIIEALQSYSKSEDMALEAKRIVDEEFSIEKWVSRIENIYLEMVYRHQNNFKTVWGIIEK
jgi:glycosyltransferase involved in cell wall biosynthesis